ncbi:hypothetical protein E6C76_01505 [Pseudothauera nasutitermitis]|uniref:Secretin/TonB short N-terminal domain-containing protein n=1 Tax=Pseudothauera nasutitermitis TaxID=2565930 RepID=A0A4S4B475_9RHOO|nr:TonB-dependent receptor plug domain-containing protein [Pseudothauera nasutitermitis]THF67091.1 hypothetical protein E6C76_01505 [Pseudothauera nasutitermitis]
MKRCKPLLATVLLALGSHASAAPFDQPAQALDLALGQLARAAGLQLVTNPTLVAGQQARSISNAPDLQAALAQLLAGTGLQARIEGDTLIVETAPRTATLPAVTVSATHERGGRTEGTGSYTTGSTSAASGLNLSLRETPQSVTVVTRQRLDDQALDSIEKVFEQTPGIYHLWTGPAVGGSNSSAYARGYRVNSYQIDGVTVPSDAWALNGWGGGAALDTAIYDSIAIVRGATGLLSGAGDPSASISLIRKRPTHEFQASVEQSMGRWSQRRSVADVGGPLNAAGSLRSRLVAAYDEGGSWSDRYQGYHSVAYGVLEADLGDRTMLTLSLEHAR